MSWRERSNGIRLTSEKEIPCPTCGKPAKEFEKHYGERAACPDCVTRRHRRATASWTAPALPVATPDFATGPDYPRPWMYHFENGAGAPLLTGTVLSQGGTYVDSLITALARFPLVTVHTTPFSDFHPEIIGKLKALNPRIIALWYDTFVQRFLFANPGTMWKAEWDLEVGHDFVDTSGQPWPFGGGPNMWTRIDTIQAGLIDIWKNYAIVGRDAAGVFLDFANGLIRGNSFFNGLPVDPVFSGYANLAAMDAATTSALDACVNAFKAYGLVIGNGNATAASKLLWSGELFESWSSLYSANTNLDAALALIAPYMGSGIDGGGRALVIDYDNDHTFSAAWCKIARYTLGAATLYGGYGSLRPNDEVTTVPRNMAELWADEYAVTPIAAGGVHDPSGQYIGWMGRPIELPAKDGATGVWVRRFSKGVVLVNGTGSTKTVNLGTSYKRITGAHDPTINNGATEQNVQVDNNDAIFMLKL